MGGSFKFLARGRLIRLGSRQKVRSKQRPYRVSEPSVMFQADTACRAPTKAEEHRHQDCLCGVASLFICGAFSFRLAMKLDGPVAGAFAGRAGWCRGRSCLLWRRLLLLASD